MLGVCFEGCAAVVCSVNCLGWTVFYVCIEYCIQGNMYGVSAQGVVERMINEVVVVSVFGTVTLFSCPVLGRRFSFNKTEID